MSSRTLTWHNASECTYRFGSHPHEGGGKSGNQKPLSTKGTKTANPTLIAKTKEANNKNTSTETKTTSMGTNKTSMETKTKTKSTTNTTLARESDRDKRMLRMLHDAIFWVLRNREPVDPESHDDIPIESLPLWAVGYLREGEIGRQHS